MRCHRRRTFSPNRLGRAPYKSAGQPRPVTFRLPSARHNYHTNSTAAGKLGQINSRLFVVRTVQRPSCYSRRAFLFCRPVTLLVPFVSSRPKIHTTPMFLLSLAPRSLLIRRFCGVFSARRRSVWCEYRSDAASFARRRCVTNDTLCQRVVTGANTDTRTSWVLLK